MKAKIEKKPPNGEWDYGAAAILIRQDALLLLLFLG